MGFGIVNIYHCRPKTTDEKKKLSVQLTKLSDIERTFASPDKWSIVEFYHVLDIYHKYWTFSGYLTNLYWTLTFTFPASPGRLIKAEQLHLAQ